MLIDPPERVLEHLANESLARTKKLPHYCHWAPGKINHEEHIMLGALELFTSINFRGSKICPPQNFVKVHLDRLTKAPSATSVQHLYTLCAHTCNVVRLRLQKHRPHFNGMDYKISPHFEDRERVKKELVTNLGHGSNPVSDYNLLLLLTRMPRMALAALCGGGCQRCVYETDKYVDWPTIAQRLPDYVYSSIGREQG